MADLIILRRQCATHVAKPAFAIDNCRNSVIHAQASHKGGSALSLSRQRPEDLPTMIEYECARAVGPGWVSLARTVELAPRAAKIAARNFYGRLVMPKKLKPIEELIANPPPPVRHSAPGNGPQKIEPRAAPEPSPKEKR